MIGSRSVSSYAPAGYRFPREVIAVGGALVPALRPVLPRRGGTARRARISVGHMTIYRWVQTFTAEFIDAARPAWHATGDRWVVDETYSRSPGAGHTCTARSISTVGSSMFWSRWAAMALPRERCAPVR